MKTVFIKINDISEINTSKISVRDLNNRYIDKNGNMYGLKYNRQTRKVHIIKIIRTPARSADYYHQMIINHRREGHGKTAIPISDKPSVNVLDDTLDTEIDEIDEIEKEEILFNPDNFINSVIELMETHKSRLAGIMNNIKNSCIISEKDRTSSSQLNDLFRNLEIDGIQRIDKAITAHKELKSYPRSLTFYTSKLDMQGRKIIDDLNTDLQKMSYIYTSEMYHTINTLYRTILKILNDINDFFESLNLDDPKDQTASEKQYFIDAKLSIDNSLKEIKKLMQNLKMCKEYIHDSSNF